MQVTGTVTITLTVSTDIDVNRGLSEYDIGGGDGLDMADAAEKFQDWAEDEFGLMFKDAPESIETKVEFVR